MTANDKRKLIADVKHHADSVYDNATGIAVGKSIQGNLLLINTALLQTTLALYKLVDILSGEIDG